MFGFCSKFDHRWTSYRCRWVRFIIIPPGVRLLLYLISQKKAGEYLTGNPSKARLMRKKLLATELMDIFRYESVGLGRYPFLGIRQTRLLSTSVVWVGIFLLAALQCTKHSTTCMFILCKTSCTHQVLSSKNRLMVSRFSMRTWWYCRFDGCMPGGASHPVISTLNVPCRSTTSYLVENCRWMVISAGLCLDYKPKRVTHRSYHQFLHSLRNPWLRLAYRRFHRI